MSMQLPLHASMMKWSVLIFIQAYRIHLAYRSNIWLHVDYLAQQLRDCPSYAKSKNLVLVEHSVEGK